MDRRNGRVACSDPRPRGRNPRAESPSGWTVTYLTPPRSAEFPVPDPGLEYRYRSFTFVEGGRRILRAWGTRARPFVVGVERDGRRWRVLGARVGPAAARTAVREIFNLQHPIESFYRQVRSEPILSGMERRAFGLRIPRDPSVYESLVHAIVGQQLSVRAADTIRHRLDAATGASVVIAGVRVAVPPAPTRLIRLGTEGLRSVGLSRAKAAALLSLAHRELDGAFAPGRFARRGSEAIVKALDGEPGVGRWTAENAVLRGLGRPDVFVAGDLGVRLALAAYWGRTRAVDEEEARAWARSHYPGWGSYATMYLWRRWLLDGTPRPGRRRAP